MRVDLLLRTLRQMDAEDPGFASSVDQSAASVRDFCDELGVDLFDSAQVRAVLAGLALAHQRGLSDARYLALSLAVGRYVS